MNELYNVKTINFYVDYSSNKFGMCSTYVFKRLKLCSTWDSQCVYSYYQRLLLTKKSVHEITMSEVINKIVLDRVRHNTFSKIIGFPLYTNRIPSS